jgi:hypothetical protein
MRFKQQKPFYTILIAGSFTSALIGCSGGLFPKNQPPKGRIYVIGGTLTDIDNIPNVTGIRRGYVVLKDSTVQIKCEASDAEKDAFDYLWDGASPIPKGEKSKDLVTIAEVDTANLKIFPVYCRLGTGTTPKDKSYNAILKDEHPLKDAKGNIQQQDVIYIKVVPTPSAIDDKNKVPTGTIKVLGETLREISVPYPAGLEKRQGYSVYQGTTVYVQCDAKDDEDDEITYSWEGASPLTSPSPGFPHIAKITAPTIVPSTVAVYCRLSGSKNSNLNPNTAKLEGHPNQDVLYVQFTSPSPTPTATPTATPTPK